MGWEVWLEDLLPTKWSGRLAWATVVVASSAYSLPSFLPDSFLPQSPEQIFLLRLVLLLLSTTIGALSVLVTVVKAYNALKASNVSVSKLKPRAPEIQRLEGPLEQMLMLVSNFPDKSHREYGKALGLPRDQALHYLETLEGLSLVGIAYYTGGEDWHVTPTGRAYLAKFKLFGK